MSYLQSKTRWAAWILRFSEVVEREAGAGVYEYFANANVPISRWYNEKVPPCEAAARALRCIGFPNGQS